MRSDEICPDYEVIFNIDSVRCTLNYFAQDPCPWLLQSFSGVSRWLLALQGQEESRVWRMELKSAPREYQDPTEEGDCSF